MIPGSHKFGYSRNNRILFFHNASWLCHPNILAIVELALQMIHIFFQKYHCHFPKMYLLRLILFTIKVYAQINIFKISFVRSQTFTLSQNSRDNLHMFLQLGPVSCQRSSQLETRSLKGDITKKNRLLKAIYSVYLSSALSEMHVIYINTSSLFSGKRTQVVNGDIYAKLI